MEPSSLRRIWILPLVLTLPAAAQETMRGAQPSGPLVDSEPAPGTAQPVPVLGLRDAAPPTLATGLSDAVPRGSLHVVETNAGLERIVGDAPGEDPDVLSLAGGSHRPPFDERLDQRLAAFARPADGRAEDEVYAFALLAHRVSDERLAALEQAGARLLGLHQANAVKLAVRRDRVAALAAHTEVRWLGVARPEHKLRSWRASSRRPGRKPRSR